MHPDLTIDKRSAQTETFKTRTTPFLFLQLDFEQLFTGVIQEVTLTLIELGGGGGTEPHVDKTRAKQLKQTKTEYDCKCLTPTRSAQLY